MRWRRNGALNNGRLVLQQPFFSAEAATVSAEATVAPQNSMAGNDNGQSVVTVRSPHGPTP